MTFTRHSLQFVVLIHGHLRGTEHYEGDSSMKDQDGFHLLNPGLDHIVTGAEQNQIRLNNQPHAVGDSMYFEDFMKHQNNRTCVFVQGGCDRDEKACVGGGGLSDTIGFINSVFDSSLLLNKTFVFPSVHPPAHGIGDRFRDIFIAETRERRRDTPDINSTRLLHVHVATCDPTHRKMAKRDLDLRHTHWIGRSKCTPFEFKVPRLSEKYAFDSDSSKYFGDCERMVIFGIGKLALNFNYVDTGSYFRKRFFDTHPPKFKLPGSGLQIPGSKPISVVLHVRLGDVATCTRADALTCKRTDPAFYLSALESLTNLFPLASLHVVTVTEDTKHPDVIQILKAYNSTVQHSDVVTDFNTMVYSDILICGKSGFCRLAAVLQAHTKPSFRIVLESDSYPLGYLNETVSITNESFAALASGEVVSRSNSAIKALQERVK